MYPIPEPLNIQHYTKLLEQFQYHENRFSKKTINIGKHYEMFYDC